MAAVTWNAIAIALAAEPVGARVRLAKNQVLHPLSAGLRPGMGLPVGQQADYRMKRPDCTGLHVQDFGLFYEAHIDRVDPACDPVEHARQDAPALFVGGAVALGALAGLALGRTKEATLVGALLGAAVGGIAAATAAGMIPPIDLLPRPWPSG